MDFSWIDMNSHTVQMEKDCFRFEASDKAFSTEKYSKMQQSRAIEDEKKSKNWGQGRTENPNRNEGGREARKYGAQHFDVFYFIRDKVRFL